MWQYARHGRSPLSQLLKSAHDHSIISWFLSSMARCISHVLQICDRYNIYNREWEKEDQISTNWVILKRKKGKVLVLFWHFCASVVLDIASMYPSEIPTQQQGTLTHPLALAIPASRCKSPKSSLSNCLFLTDAFSDCR